MSSFFQLVQIRGDASSHVAKPQACAACGCNKLYVQSDFNRNIGLWMVGIASVLTVYFAYEGYNWWTTWSPMLAFLIVDRVLALVSPLVVICYQCEHLHRGLGKSIAQEFPGFDLDEHDRILYSERTQ